MRAKTWLVAAAFFLLVAGMQTSALASPRGGGGRGSDMDGHIAVGAGFHAGFHPRAVFVGPAFGWGWGWGWDYPWYWDPYYYSGPVEVHRVNYGTLEFKVKPADTKVYVDQKYIGMVKDLDHHKAYLAAGNHEIKLVAPDERTTDRTIYVAAGQKIKIDEVL